MKLKLKNQELNSSNYKLNQLQSKQLVKPLLKQRQELKLPISKVKHQLNKLNSKQKLKPLELKLIYLKLNLSKKLKFIISAL